MADELVEVLRVGDYISVNRHDKPGKATYGITKLNWWTVPAGDVDATWSKSPEGEPALVRIVDNRMAALTDPRTYVEDEWGAGYDPVGRDLIADSEWSNIVQSVGLATDPELIAFSLESVAVARAFAEALSTELRTMHEAMTGLQSFRKGSA